MTGTKPRNPILSSLISTYTDFAENTSIHGLKYTVQKEVSLLERLLWVLMVLLGIAGSIFMVGLFWERYTDNPTRTSIQTSYAPTTAIPFPAITICNINKVFMSKVRKFVRKLFGSRDLFDNFDEDHVAEIFPQLLAYTDPSPYNVTDLEMLQNLLNKNDHSNMGRVVSRISPGCKDILVKCKWESNVIDCARYFVTTLTNDGLCCSFNYDPSGRVANYTFFYGIRMGLTVLLNPVIEEVQYSPLHSIGMKVLIHHPHSYPNTGSNEKILAVGRETLLQIEGTRFVCSEEVRKLTPKQRECIYNDEHRLRHFPQYTGENCATECSASDIYEKCECVPYFFMFSDKPVCNVTKIPCLAEYRVERRGNSDGNCDCPRQCEDISYDVLSTTTKFVNSEFFISPFLKDVNTTETSMLLHIFFSSQTQTIILRNTITSTIYLLSSFGGVFSLLLGCSFISGIEIIYYVCIRFFVNLKLLNKSADARAKKKRSNRKNENEKGLVYPREAWNGKLYKESDVYTVYSGKNVFLN